MKRTAPRRGTVVIELFDSVLLKGNPLGDPPRRRIPVWLPPSYASRGRYPVIYMITGFTGFGEMQLNRGAWSESLPERLDRLTASGAMRECIVVMPDCFTRYGGSQYLDSSATGRYESHLLKELVPHVDRSFRTLARPSARAIAGKSSGGYGAIVLGMRHPDIFGLVACHSGDMLFEYCYLPDFPKALNAFHQHGGTAASWLRWWEKERQRLAHANHAPLNTVAMASCYSPNPRARLGFDLPFDERTGELRPDVWKRWLAWDPVRMLPSHAANLRRLRRLFLDCGTRDEFALNWGMRVFAARAKRLGVKCVVEEFPDGHMNIPYRYDRSLPLLAAAMK
jgi:enterochelin esterase family protein